jgi:CheY-like chemotaxis protein
MSRILVVEDDPHILRVICLWLARHGHETLEARNGATALELAKQHHLDILITDINMPGIDGLQMLDQMKQQDCLPQGLVVLTNRWDHREIGLNLAKWGVRVVPKPFSPTKLAKLIEELDEQVCSRAVGQRGARQASTEHE